jgi:xylan 1,4-beta-xylosidase
VLVRHRRIDADHSNIVRHWDGGDWPDEAGWARLHDADHLEDLKRPRRVIVGVGGRVHVDFELPMPAVSLIEIVPTD